MLRQNLANHPVTDFQHWPRWLASPGRSHPRRTDALHRAASDSPADGPDPASLKQIFAGLCAAQLLDFHMLLDAEEVVLRVRIEASDEARRWRLACLAADLVVDTTASAPEQAARAIASVLPTLSGIPSGQLGQRANL